VGIRWHIGDLGRFEIESPKLPRFEVISSSKTEVQVWYSGTAKPTSIPKRTFLDDCVKWWHVDPITEAIPKWLYEGCSFTLDPEAGKQSLHVPIAQIADQARGHLPRAFSIHGLDLSRQTLTFRRRQGDYISCTTPQILVLLPIKLVLESGRSRKTRWDLLRTTDILDPDEDEL
jgi:hypothetical protein